MKIFLVVPCFNEESRWSSDYWSKVLAIDELTFTFVNDGSSDGTLSVLKNLESTSKINVKDLSQNVGKGEAVRQGLLSLTGSVSEGDWVGFIDADGAFGVDDLRRFVALLTSKHINDHYSSVWASRVALKGRDIRRRQSRHYLGRAIATILSARFSGLPYDTQAGLKFFKWNDQLRESLSSNFSTRWLFDVELYLRMDALSGPQDWIWEEPVIWWEDVDGSKVAGKELLRISREVTQMLMSKQNEGVRQSGS